MFFRNCCCCVCRLDRSETFVFAVFFCSAVKTLSRQVVVESRSRSLSQTFWAHHQAADGGVHASTTMQGALARLEAEIVTLRTENTRWAKNHMLSIWHTCWALQAAATDVFFLHDNHPGIIMCEKSRAFVCDECFRKAGDCSRE